MASMQWRKSPQQLIETFEAVVPSSPTVLRKMFGYPAAFVNGNMFMGLFQEDMFLRLSDADRSELLQVQDARTFEPMPGRPMREYVAVPPVLLASQEKLRPWVAKALAYGAALRSKEGKPKLGKPKPKKTVRPAARKKKR
jgi:TfoX/Sxy family transcriptional regulator of competence genes